MVIFATKYGSSAIAATSIIRQINYVIAAVGGGLSNSSGFYIGKCIGEKDVRGILSHYRAAMMLSLIITTGITLFLLACKRPMNRMFTSHEEIIELLTKSFSILLLYRWFLVITSTSVGCVRAAGL